MTWYNTPKVQETEGAEAEGEGEGDKQEEEEKVEDFNSMVKELYGDDVNSEKNKALIANLKQSYRVKDTKEVKKKKFKMFTEDDYPLRTPFAG